jgi:hypothetical protein
MKRLIAALFFSQFGWQAMAQTEDTVGQIPVTNHSGPGGLFVGAGLGFGQSYLTKGETSPGLAIDFSVEPGFVFKTGSWSRVEASAEVFFGRIGYRENSGSKLKGSLSTFGLLPKFGYGYSLGDGLSMVWGIGVGPALTKYEASGGGTKVESTSSAVGIAARLFGNVVVPMSDSMDVTAGLKFTHYAIDPGDVKTTTGAVSTTASGDPINMNVPEVSLGLRLKM